MRNHFYYEWQNLPTNFGKFQIELGPARTHLLNLSMKVVILFDQSVFR